MLFLLESEGFDCVLYHAAQDWALPGRPKTDKADSVWLAKITERGALPGSFVPPEDIRRLRTHTRYRRHLTQARTAKRTGRGKLPGDAHLKLSSVIPGIHGVCGRAMPGGHRRRGAYPHHARPARPRHHARQDRPA